MYKPQRKSSINRDRVSSGYSGIRNTPLLRSGGRLPLSAAKTNQRESYIGTANQHAVKDPRPLNDKSYIKRSIVEIIQILSMLNYPKNLTSKMMNPPSNKEYQQIFEFLAFEILGSYKILGKADEEMLKCLKDLGYPYNITRSTLNNVGAMSCWPHALGALMWIADLARYCQGSGDAINQSLCLHPRKMVKHEFISRSYSEFMRGNDGPYPELEAQLKQSLDDLDSDDKKLFEKKQTERAKLTAEYDMKLQEKESCSATTEQIEAKRSNIQKIKQYLSECDDYLNYMQNMAKGFEDDIKKKEEELKSANETLIQLRSQVSQQEMSRDDVEKLSRKKRLLQEALTAATSRLEELKNEKWELDVQTGKLVKKRDEFAETFNSQFKIVSKSLLLMKDNLPPELLTDFDPAHFVLSLGHKGLDNESRLTNKIEPFLTSINNKMLELLGNLESEFYNISKRAKQDGEILADLQKEKEELQEQYQKLVKENEILSEDIKKAEEVYNSKIKKAETTLEQLKSLHSESLDDLVSSIEEARERTRKFKEKHKTEESAALESIQRVLVLVNKFQITLHERVADVVERLDQADKEALARMEAVKAKILKTEGDVEACDQFIKNLKENLQIDDEEMTSSSPS